MIPTLAGAGSPTTILTPADMRRIVREAIRTVQPRARVLAVIPDRTRDDNTDVLFPI
ncbi:MAG: hypothetical protein JF601_12830, partial [Acidobacteria bacterium]|nr:hypothetical protein [Acidobacteriota bacterium]